VALGVDGAPVDTGAVAELEAMGLRAELTCVLSTRRVAAPAKPVPQARLRPLQGEEDWRQAIELGLAADAEFSGHAGERAYMERRMAAVRSVCEAGHGSWFGAFRDGEMVAGLGIFAADPDYHAAEIYRSLGFRECNRQLQLERLAPS
jgi:hypothetical protein